MSVRDWPIIQISESDIRLVIEALIARKNSYWHLHQLDTKRSQPDKAEEHAEKAVNCMVLIDIFTNALSDPF